MRAFRVQGFNKVKTGFRPLAGVGRSTGTDMGSIVSLGIRVRGSRVGIQLGSGK